MSAAKNAPPEWTAYIAFFSTIDDCSTAALMDAIATRLPKKTTTLYLLLNTSGGSVAHGVAIYNLLKALPYTVIIHNVGNVDSIGNTVFMAGKKRYAAPHTTFLLHKVACNADDVLKLESGILHEKMSTVRSDEQRIRAILTKNSKLTDDDMKRFFRNGEAKDADFALEKGMIDEIREVSLPSPSELIVIQSGTPANKEE